MNDKEYILSPTHAHLSGFTDRAINRLANTRLKPNILAIETNHVKRGINKNYKDISPLLEYQLWLEAGKMDKACIRATNNDESLSYNSNIWRNYRSSAGLYSGRSSGVNESIASLYPINVPAPSQVGPNSLKRYFEQNKSIFKSEEAYRKAVEKVDKEATSMKYLRLKSEMRNPPLDYNGNILPPKNFRKYPPLSRKNNLQPVESFNSMSYPHLSLLPAPKIEPIDAFLINDKTKLDATRIKMKRFMPIKTYSMKPEEKLDEKITGNMINNKYE